jgi:GH25 family lysozyme M1 (1,4-beta-N-acetylmuramidase)
MTDPDRSPPFLFADVSAYQAVPDAALLTGPWCGAILKATEGLHYAPEWFVEAWRAISQRSELLRGWYHFLRFGLPGRDQADFALAHVERACGSSLGGEILPVVDVERNKANLTASAAQVEDCVSAFAARIEERTGRGTLLYGRGAMRDLQIRSKMGCVGVWNPGYTAEMPMNGLEAWTVDDVVLWQYAGDRQGDASRHLLPLVSPIGGDCSVYVDGARKPTWESLRRRLCGEAL